MTNTDPRLTALHNALPEVIPPGYVYTPVCPTGGGCQAIAVEDPAGGRELLVSDGDAGLPLTSEEDTLVVVGLYEEGDWVGYVELEVTPYVVSDVVRTVSAWINREPMKVQKV